MKKISSLEIQKQYYYLFLGIYLFFLLFSFIYPPFNPDSIRYAIPGNPFVLQYYDYIGYPFYSLEGAFIHGRYLTHVLLRIILQVPEPLMNILFSLILTGIVLIYTLAIKPDFYKKYNKNFIYTFIIFFSLLLLLPRILLAEWFVHAHPISNFLSMGLILLFLMPYRALLSSNSSKENTFNIVLFIILGIVAGSTHEQAVAVPFFLIGFYIYLSYQKHFIPKWYWIGFVAFCIGLFFVLFPAGNIERVNTYGGGLSWEFMGNTYNWSELGVEKYFYAFIKHFLLGNYTTTVLPHSITFVVLWILLYKKKRNTTILETALFYFLLSWMIVGVMIASPTFNGGPLDNGRIFLYISLMILFYQCLEDKVISQKVGKITSMLFFLFLMIVSIMQMVLLAPFSIEFRKTIIDLELQVDAGMKDVIIAEQKTASLKTPIFSYQYSFNPPPRFLLYRYQLDSLVVTNQQRESNYFYKK